MNHLGDYDVIVIGAGHAGIEAAHAAATLGAKTAVFTMSLDAIGNMPCNPSIGGTAKGTLVRELDALGGVMGLAADATYLQSRMLNKGKGPAVHALRVQTDRKRYHEYMKHALELTPGLAIHQAEVVGIEVENGHVKGVVTQLNGEYSAKCVVIATGTNLGGKIFVGDAWYASGPDGMHAANALTDSLKAAGLPLRRFKTGTPARVHRRSIDFSQLECQPELFGVFPGLRVCQSEYPGSENSDGTGHMPAIFFEVVKAFVANLVQIHFHAIDNGQQKVDIQIEGFEMRKQGLRDQVVRSACLHFGDFLAPAIEFETCLGGIHGLVIDNIVHLTTKGVKSRDGFTAVCREKTETDVKTGTACRRFLLAIFVRQHKRRNE